MQKTGSSSKAAVGGRAGVKDKGRDPMKFKNGDITLEEAIERNGGHVVMTGFKSLLNTSW